MTFLYIKVVKSHKESFRNCPGNLVESLGSFGLSTLDRMLLPHAIVLLN